VHLGHHSGLEVVIVKDHRGGVRELADRILSLRGVNLGRLV
jgi:metal-responsive CopG/Arc/MetJ family transcriptional regulator